LHHNGKFFNRHLVSLSWVVPRMRSNQRSSLLGRTLYFLIAKGEKMDAKPQPEPQETNLQERAVETLFDNSLPAAQIIEEQNNEVDVTRNNAPRFIP